MVAAVFVSPANAGESSNDTQLADVFLEFIGLNAQINRTASTIVLETAVAREKCRGAKPDKAALSDFLNQLYSPEAMAEDARRQIQKGLSAEHQKQLHAWIESPVGKKVYAAESALQETDTATLSQLESTLVKSEQWTEERQRLIYRILRVTRIHHYVAALNTALSGAVAMASSCKADYGSLNSIEIAQHRERSDEKLIAGLMLNSFIVPTGVILQPLSNLELQAYFEFSVTEAGKQWYALVIDTVRSIIDGRIPEIRRYLATEVD